jgi:hypothetical protein
MVSKSAARLRGNREGRLHQRLKGDEDDGEKAL